MRNLIMPLLVAAASVLSTGPAYADLGDQLFKLLPNDGAADDYFGWSVATSGATAIVGAYWDDDNGSRSGSAYLFDITTGRQITKLLPNDGAAGDEFGWSIATSPDGIGAIVGAFRDDDNGNNSGSAYLFDTTTGRQIAKLLPDDGAESDLFGRSVAISPDGIGAIVGAHKNDDNGDASGSAYLFDISDPANPTQVFKLLPNDGALGDHFGFSVAISGAPGKEVAIVGAPLDDHNGGWSGSAYLFDTTTGGQLAKLLPDDGAGGDLFGWSVAIRPDGIGAIVGAIWNDDNGIESGSAYLFDISDPANPVQTAKLLPKDGAALDYFGVSVAISGARHHDDNGANSGSAYLFDISDPTNPTQIAKLLANDGAKGDRFGVSVAISGAPGMETAIVGADWDDDNGSDSGSAYLFDASYCPWDLDGKEVVGASDLLSLLASWGPCEGCPADFDGNGNVGASDLLVLLANWGPCP